MEELIIFAFFGVISMSLMGCFAVAVVNVLIRRENAYLLEERIKVVAYARHEPIDLVGAAHMLDLSLSRIHSSRSASRTAYGWKAPFPCCLGESLIDPNVLGTIRAVLPALLRTEDILRSIFSQRRT